MARSRRVRSHHRAVRVRVAACGVLGLVIGLTALLPPTTGGVGSTGQSGKPLGPRIRSFEALLEEPPQELLSVDIALMNLLCAEGLPGAEELDIDECLGRLDVIGGAGDTVA